MDNPLYIGNDNLIEWQYMANAADRSDINDATVTFQVKDSSGTVVASGSLDYVAASNGLYQGVAPSTTSLTNNAEYTIEITAVSGDINAFVVLTRYAMYRDGRC